jgi:predicted nucleic-acid-binding Zn-ribbon protein
MPVDTSMKQGVCPQCDSNEVYSGVDIPNKAGANEANTITLGGPMLAHMIPLDNYVCVNCGYVESYIGDVAELKRIAERWERADGQKKPKQNPPFGG